MIIKEITKGITHIEDLKTCDFLYVLENLSSYEITEKVDGSQILFGIDDKGFYTSRETKGGDRVYSVEDYGITFSTTYQRSAHRLLESVLPQLREAGLKLGDQVEAEVLYGALPNVVPYSEDRNYLIFLRATEGNVNIDRLKQKLDGQSLSVSLACPITEDGKNICLVENTNNWTISRVPIIKANILGISSNIGKYIDEIKLFMNEDSGIKGVTNLVIESTPLNKRPEWCKIDEWKYIKEDVKAKKEEIHRAISETLKPAIKEILLDRLVRPSSSRFGPLKENGGWIEGVVLRNRKTGHMVKIVDKSIFGSIREFAWQVRNTLTERARSVDNIVSFLGEFYVGLAAAIGHPELGTMQCKKYYSRMILEDIDLGNVKDYMLSFIENKELDLENRLDKYNRNKPSLVLSGLSNIKSGKVSYSGDIDRRTLETFAYIFEQIKIIRQDVNKATTPDELVRVIAGKYLDS